MEITIEQPESFLRRIWAASTIVDWKRGQPHIESVCIDKDKIIATDSYRMIILNNPNPIESQIVLEPDMVEYLISFIPKRKNVPIVGSLSITVSDEHVLMIDRDNLESRQSRSFYLHNYKYPEYNNLIPKDESFSGPVGLDPVFLSDLAVITKRLLPDSPNKRWVLTYVNENNKPVIWELELRKLITEPEDTVVYLQMAVKLR